jgi:hypothetical protein
MQHMTEDGSPRAGDAPLAPPDVRDGLTRLERIILLELAAAQRERPGRGVSTALLYGRVSEHVDLSVGDFQRALKRLLGGT